MHTNISPLNTRPSYIPLKRLCIWLILSFLYLFQQSQEIQIGNIQLSDDTLKTSSSYSFSLERSTSSLDIPSGSYFQISFPPEYINRITFTTGTQIDCSSLQINSSSMYCTYTSNVVRVTNAFPSLNSIKRWILQVNNVMNPFPAMDYSPFDVVIFKNDGTIFQSGTFSAKVTISQGASICSIIKYSNNIVYTRGSILINYQSKYIQTATSQYKIFVSMSTSYPNDPLSTNLNAQISGYSSLGNTGMFNFEIDYTTAINISLLMPPSTKTVDNFIYLQALIKNKGTIDSCYVSLTSITPSTLAINFTATTQQVQKQANYSLSILPSSPIFASDSLIIEFPSTYDLSLLTSAAFTLGIFGTKSIVKSGNILTISNLVTNSIQGRTISFDLNRLINPFDSRPVLIKIKTITNDNFLRDQSSISYTIKNGLLQVNSFTCNNYQIGYQTACKINFTLSNSIKNDSQIRIGFPSNSWMISQSGSNTQCATQSSSSQLKSQFQCRYYDKNFVFSQFSDLTVNISAFTATINIEKSSIDIDHRIQLPWQVNTFSFSIVSYSLQNYSIDSGSFSLITLKRELFNSDNNSFSFEKLQTMTPSNVYLTYSLPYDKGVSYSIKAYLPLDLTVDTASIIPSYGTVLDYNIPSSNLTMKLTDVTLQANNITVSGFKTYISTKPIVYTFQISYQSIIYFYFSQSVSIPNPKQIQKLTLTQVSSVAYAINQITLTVSELSGQDIIIFTTSDYTSYLISNQAACSTSIISCNLDGTLTILSVNNVDSLLKLTSFTFNLRNSPFVGNSNFSLSVLDSTKNYLKQKNYFILAISQMNSLPTNFLSYTSTNPYFNQSSVLTLYFILIIPNATKIVISLPNDYKYISGKCIKNCFSIIFNSVTNNFQAAINGLDISIQLAVTNPMDFSQLIGVTSKDSFNRNQDYGIIKIQPKCTAPCRSCSDSNTSLCISCYTFNQNKTLSNGKCIISCPQGEYQTVDNSLYYCKSCPSSCKTCTSSAICQLCNSNFTFFQNSCLSNCPTTYYAYTDPISNISECKQCFNTCLQCSGTATTCSKCISTYYLYQNSCRTDCPTNWYIISGECVQCTLNCQVCQDGNAFCETCKSGFYLYQGTCFSTCPVSGLVKNITSGKCQTCPTPCLVCGQFVTQCTQCQSSYFLLNNECLTDCSNAIGYFTNSIKKTCQICKQPCKACSASADYCDSCISGTFLYNHKCFNSCLDGTYSTSLNSIQQCVKCVFPCLKCSDNSSCASCSSPYVLNGSFCVQSCDTSSFINQNNQCEVCQSKCKTCNLIGCLTCSNNSQYLLSQDCVTSCSPLFKNQASMVCQTCQSPCQTCTLNSTTCKDCINGYSYLQTTNLCYKVCPPTYFTLNSYCKLCTLQNQACKECGNSINGFVCSSCQNSAFFYGDICVLTCPEKSQAKNGICISQTCDQLPDCQVCSGSKCLTCKALYTLQSGSCQFKVVSAISQLPVPFPFLILIIFTIISSFILKIYFNKMYTPLYLYSFCGLFEAGCLTLWTLLSVLTSEVNLQQTIVNIYFATLIIIIGYIIFNILSFSFGFCLLRKDKKYLSWQMQDNKSCSLAIAILSLIVSFRFYLVKFSKLGNKQIFSATLEGKEKYSFLNFLAIGSIFLISVPALILSAFLTYTQTQMNYLFFTCLEMAIVSVIMIVLSIMAVLTPNEYILYKKDQYKKGFDSENLQGKSVAQLMLGFPVIEQEYHEARSVFSDQKQVIQRNLFNSQNQSVQNIEVVADGKDLLSQKITDQNDLSDYQITKQIESKLELDQIQLISSLLQKTLNVKKGILQNLINQENNQIIQEVNSQFEKEKEKEDPFNSTTKPIGFIVKQLINKFEEYSSDSQQSDIGEQINDQFQSIQMNSSKLLKGNTSSRKKKQKLRNHSNLTLDQQIQFIKHQEKVKIRQQNLKDIQKIKKLVQQLAIQQREQKILRGKLQQLNTQLEGEDYIKIRQKIQRSKMETQDKLSRLNQMYARRKEERNKTKKSRKIKQENQNDQINDKEQQQLLNYQPKERDIQQINSKKLKVSSTLKKNYKMPQNIQIQRKNKNLNNQKGKPQKEKYQKGKIIKNNLKQNPKELKKVTSNNFVKGNNAKNNQQVKINGQINTKNRITTQKKSISDLKNKKPEQKNIRMSTAVNKKTSKFNSLQPISQQDKKDKTQQLFLPLESLQKNRQQIYTSDEDIDDLQNDQISQDNIPRTLVFNQPLQQDEPDDIEIQQQPNIVFNNHQQQKIHQNDNFVQIGQTQQNKNSEVIVNKSRLIEYHQGPFESLKDEPDHWPIDPKLQQKILSIEMKANSYLSKDKKRKRINNYASEQLHNNIDDSQQKLFRISGPQTKYTELNQNQKINFDRENSIFYGQRQSEIDLNPLHGEVIVFQDDEQIIDHQQSQENQPHYQPYPENQQITLTIDSKNKISKRRANRSVINLRPGKY